VTDNEATPAARPPRRRASRPVGPAGEPAADVGGTVGTARVASSGGASTRSVRPVGPPPRRPANRRLVRLVGLVAGLAAVLVLAGAVAVLGVQQTHAEAAEARSQRFVDTASQTVVNMFSHTQDDIEQSVDRFIGGTSGPLHDMMSQEGNAENLKILFRETNSTSEAVIKSAALEGIDEDGKNGSVLVSAWVTISDADGTNMPSQPYRLRVIVHEDDSGNMTAYDLKYPNGGN
jgi:Mce-associated membrane protein